jgi:ferredoxin
MPPETLSISDLAAFATGGAAVSAMPPSARTASDGAPQPAQAGAAAGPAPLAAPERLEAREEEQALAMEPYIDTALCTSCNECTNLNNRLFAYDENKQAYIKDPRAGSFAQLVRAAELCPVKIIHPGTPLNPKEKDLDKWIARATPFN